LLPEKAKELAEQAKGAADGAADKIPGLHILEGLTVDATGNILNDDGDTIGQLIEGNPKELQGKVFNSKGEILSDDGEVIGRAKVLPEAADLYDDAEDAAGDVEDQAEGAEDEAGEAVDGVGEAVDQELPGIEALDGLEVNSSGNVIDSAGNLIGELAEGDVDKVKGLAINDQGEVLG
jgi:hypothetical protein